MRGDFSDRSDSEQSFRFNHVSIGRHVDNPDPVVRVQHEKMTVVRHEIIDAEDNGSFEYGVVVLISRHERAGNATACVDATCLTDDASSREAGESSIEREFVPKHAFDLLEDVLSRVRAPSSYTRSVRKPSCHPYRESFRDVDVRVEENFQRLARP
jgi:hypothetical protein